VPIEPLLDLELRGTSLRRRPELGAGPVTLVRCDLGGADLRGLDLHGADIGPTDLDPLGAMSGAIIAHEQSERILVELANVVVMD
jgi:hypothetical protein